MNVRRNVYRLGGPWPDEVLWYARGVQVMQQRELADPTGWRFYAGIHGFDLRRWTDLGYLRPGEPGPTRSDWATYWVQCQHGSWYFLPWHRGYLWAIEQLLREAIVGLGGPGDWALPYWNYMAPGEADLPTEFADPTWPDGGDNPLFLAARFGPTGTGRVTIPPDRVNLNALREPDFTGVASGGSPGFGGVDTGFSHDGSPHGRLEQMPHDQVHVLIGGRSPQRVAGAMADPATAAIDPIFWLHHANIDRLWVTWLQLGAHADPVDPDWLGGPATVGQRPFTMPVTAGRPWPYTPADVLTTEQLDYVYDDLSPAAPVADATDRADGRAVAAAVEAGGELVTTPTGPSVENIGASADVVPLAATPTRAIVELDGSRLRRATDSIRGLTDAETADRVLLNLENVRGTADGTSLAVYLGLPEGADPVDHPELKVGDVGLFGLRAASDPDREHAGEGITYVLDVTDAVGDGRLDEEAERTGALPVTVVPLGGDAEDPPDVTIGRVSLFRQGA